MEAQDFSAGAYYTLLSALAFFIFLSAFLVYFLSKELKKSLMREEEGSVYSRSVLLAQEVERMRISRELHDTIAQDLRYLSLSMNKISKTQDSAKRDNLCKSAADFHSELIKKVRDICTRLVPPDFRFQGLQDALCSHCHDFGVKTGIDCRIDIDLSEKEKLNITDAEKLLQIFRIVQEALTNVEKHAQASEAIVILRCDSDGGISIGISDDGKGFNPLKAGKKGFHLGIRGMEERAALLGGKLEIKSEKGEGTLVRLHLPKGAQK
ncbi:MAG: sensor histidine kinase [Treponema sp.]|jgi:signal transduction histidine kinase|nr:sensor histidine kinase [Treponema sp.]